MIVVDASVVVDALVFSHDNPQLWDYLAEEDLHAPALLDHDVTSALRELVLGRHLEPDRAEDALTDFDDLPIVRWPATDGLRRRVLQLRDDLSARDAAYLALAEALECPMVTRDARLDRSAGRAGLDADILVR